ncbi:MAG: hypothetical protein ACHQEM_03695, partial [Chitinophagales bacterium]
VWHNVNIVDLGGDNDAKADFNVENFSGQPIRLIIQDTAIFPKHAFTETGTIYLELDTVLFQAWQKGGSQGTGIRKEDNRVQILEPRATLDNIILPEKIRAKTRIIFTKNAKMIPDKYFVRVYEFANAREKEIRVGGVSYEITTYKK